MSKSTVVHSLNLKPDIFDAKYELSSTIGRGKGSVVYKAFRLPEKGEVYDASLDPLALKILTGTDRNPEEALKRIKREARALTSLNHPNIIRANNYVARQDCCYLSLEYAAHGDLSRAIQSSKNKISVKSAIRITRSILRGLEHIHNNSIIHRDIKLENILVFKDLSIKITDFSISLLDGEKNDLSIVNKPVGTMEYLAPECLRGEPFSVVSDLYAAGVVFYKLLTNRFPFESNSIHESIKLKSLGRYRELGLECSELNLRVEGFVKRILSHDPSYRFQSAREAEQALYLISTGRPFEKTHDYLEPREIELKADNLERQGRLPRKKSKALRKTTVVFASAFVVLIGAKQIAQDNFKLLWESLSSRESVLSENIGESIVSDLETKSGLGIIKGLYGEGTSNRFSILPYEKDTALLTIGSENAEAISINLIQLREGKNIIVKGADFDLSLVPTKRTQSGYEGQFHDLLNGNMGTWKLNII